MKYLIVPFVTCCLLFLPVASASAADTPPLASAGEPTAEPSLDPLATALARALGSDGFRHALAEALADSPYVEGRVALKRLLARDADLRRELSSLVDEPADWKRMFDALPELELYLPREDHRGGWDGGAELQVVVPLDGSERFRVYGLDGSQEVGSDPSFEVPTLLLGPSEIDFDDLESALAGGPRTGSALRRVPDSELGDGGTNLEDLFVQDGIVFKTSGVDSSRHTYLTAFRITQWHEPPIQGDMEIEVFGSVDGSFATCHRYTDIHPEVTYYLPAPGSSGADKIAYAVPTGSNTVDIVVYEDDDGGCQVNSGDDYLGTANLQITQYGTLYGTSNGEASVRVGTQSTTCGDSTCAGDESRFNCCSDCKVCGDSVCGSCETHAACPQDCPDCGDSICERTKGETEYNCPADCDSCGNGLCQPGEGETNLNCPQDCCDPGAEICVE